MKKRSHKHTLISYIFLLATLLALASLTISSGKAQGNQWSSQQPIPGFDPRTEPPVLVADQNRTVHAFSSQWFGESTGDPQVEVVYNQWTLDGGWTTPTDILMSPLFKEAWIMAACLDKNGIMHLVFFGGHDLGANVYYTQAPVFEADRASAWSKPLLAGEDAKTPKSVALVADDNGDFVILYGGNRDGNGVYAVYSRDGGVSWSDPAPLFLTHSDGLLTFGLQLYLDRSGWLHAMWNTVTLGGQGRGIYYSRSESGTGEWSDPIKLADTPSGYGAWSPTIIEHGGALFAMYNVSAKIFMRRSSDNGRTWTEPVLPFIMHTGVNGTLSLVVDGNDTLHLFFGQRITGNPDIHGMWHSLWQDGRWTEPEAIVSGPRVVDTLGAAGFDPYDARAVVSQGDVILVTWRTDPGDIKPNGVWYSYSVLDAPELPVVALPEVTQVSEATPTATVDAFGSASNDNSNSVSLNSALNTPGSSHGSGSPAKVLVIATIPALLLIVFAFALVIHQRHR